MGNRDWQVKYRKNKKLFEEREKMKQQHKEYREQNRNKS